MSSPNVPAPTTSSATSTTKDPRLTAVIAILTIIGVVLIGLIVFLTLRLRRRDSGKDGKSAAGPFHGTSIWEREHPAAQISPFGAASNTPNFNHKPGSDMRIAFRRPDGAWHFADSRTPFNPAGVSDLENTPSPASAISSRFFPFSPHYDQNLNGSNLTLNVPMSTQEQEANAMRLAAAEPGKGHIDDWGTPSPLSPSAPSYQRDPREQRQFPS